MKLIDPITFHPIFMERPWGGRRLETVMQIPLPSKGTIGELWAMVDRPETESIIDKGPLEGKTLHELWRDYREEIFGNAYLKNPSPRFPLLCKLLDACEPLSLQVHPPTAQAALLGGEPKTECWYILYATPGAAIDVGLREGVTREQFSEALQEGNIESLVHRIPVHTGESMFLPSGRLHGIGKGIMIVEIQQNSDTTYRVFDGNRKGLDGKLRQLHIPESMASINFDDYEPELQHTGATLITDCPYFKIEKWILEKPRLLHESNRLLSKLASADEVQDASDAQNRSVYENTRGFSDDGATKQFAPEVEYRRPEGRGIDCLRQPEGRDERERASQFRKQSNSFSLITCLTGLVRCGERIFNPGSFFLVPACMKEATLFPEMTGTSILKTQLNSTF